MQHNQLDTKLNQVLGLKNHQKRCLHSSSLPLASTHIHTHTCSLHLVRDLLIQILIAYWFNPSIPTGISGFDLARLPNLCFSNLEIGRK